MDNEQIAKRYKTELASAKNLLFLSLLVWTVFLLAFSWLDFFISKLEVNDALVTSYLILLGVYIVHKETSRWTGIKLNVKPGELFVYVWWISLLAMFLIGFFANLEISSPIKHLAYEVLGAFLLSEISKSINAYKRSQ